MTQEGFDDCRVILPITDPYVVHHGALGSYATIYLRDLQHVESARAALAKLPGVEHALTRDEAAAKFDLPTDRIGDLVVVGDETTVLGTSATRHDLSDVKQGLRSFIIVSSI